MTRPLARRTTGAVASLLLVPLAAGPSVAAASGEAGLALSRTVAITGEAVTMTATVDPGNGPGTRRPVALQRETRRGWDTVATARTNRAGRHDFALSAPRATTSYRVRAKRFFAGETYLAAATSRVRTLTVQEQWTKLFAPSAPLEVGEDATFTAELAPTRTGRGLRLQVRTDAGWATLARQEQDDRFFTFTVPVDEAGSRAYRTRAEPWDGARAVVSGVLTLTAHG